MDPNAFVVIFHIQHLDWPVSRDHVLLQLHYRNVIVAVAEIEVRLSIIVDENIWIDRTNFGFLGRCLGRFRGRCTGRRMDSGSLQ